MAAPAVSTLTEREVAREILNLANRVLDMLERKPMGTAPEPEPIADRVLVMKRSA